jgi:uncharacterized protein YndB with AHSA1/START domain
LRRDGSTPGKNNMKRVYFDMEFIFRASPTILYQFLTTPACLTRWFCDSVDIQEDIYTFGWQGYTEVAGIIDDIEDERLRFQWHDAPLNEYLEFRMYKSPVTDETVLEITDFADAGEVDDQRLFWESQMKTLRQETGG